MNTFLQSDLKFNPLSDYFNFQLLYQFKIVVIVLLLLSVTGCSVVDSYRSPQPQARNIPKIPEIKRQGVNNPRYNQQKKETRIQKAPVKGVTMPQNRVITSQERARQRIEAKELLQKQAKESATVDIDPYAAVPESSTNSTNNKVATVVITNPDVASNSTINSSPAVKSLMVGARADLALGKNRSAVSKLERGLRIEAQNPELWHLLSKVHYSDNDFTQSITMAKKSIRYSNNDNLIAQNWALIKKAGEKSGNATAIKEALDYIKLNP